MSFPKKTILIKGNLLETVGVGVNVFGFDLQKEADLHFDGVLVPVELSQGKEYWVLVERTTRKVMSAPRPSIEEARAEFLDRYVKAMRRAVRRNPLFTRDDMLNKIKEGVLK
jgi:hypothetical protein